MTALETLIEKINAMGADERVDLQKRLDEAGVLDQFEFWKPQDGPQSDGYFSRADLMLYGGAAGGGKTDLIAGLALFAHHRVAIFRDTVKSMKGLRDRMNAIMGKAGMGRLSGSTPQWLGPGGRSIEFGHLGKPGAEDDWQGQDHDLKAFDEGSQLDPAKVLFVMGWLRSTRKGQRCRAIIATNPPIGGQGDYLIEWFGPWLDPMHPLFGTVKPGELLWGNFVSDGSEIKTEWFTEPTKIEIEGELVDVPSRTFIPARTQDNTYLTSEYLAKLNSQPEPLRTALLTGDFMAARQDHKWQVIPSEWVELAFQRYRDGVGKGAPMTVLAADVAQGGPDKTVVQPLHDIRFEPPTIERGIDTKDGAAVGSIMIRERRDSALLAVDCTGGWGGDTVGFLERENGIAVERCVFSTVSGASDPVSKMPYFNLRAELYWGMRLALHPKSGLGLAIAPSQRLKAQLTAHRWDIRGGKILIESKENIKDRTGSSPDESDAGVIALHYRKKGLVQKVLATQSRMEAVPQADPLDGW